MARLKILFFISIMSVTAGAQTSAPSLDSAIRDVWTASPQLAAQREQLQLAKGDVWRRYLINEPQLQFGKSDGSSQNSYGLGLTVPFPGKSQAFSEADRAHETAQSLELRAKRYDLTKLVTQSYLDCAAATAALDVQKATTADLQSLARALQGLYEAGHSTQAEKIGSELQAHQAQWDLETSADHEKALCQKYADTLAQAKGAAKGSETVTTSLVLPDDIDAATINDLGDQTADQLRAVATRDVAHSTASTATWAQLPDFTFNVIRNNYVYLPASPNGKAWTTSAGVSVTLPILFPFHESVESRRTRSQAFIDQNVSQLQLAAASADQEDAGKEYQRSRRRLQDLRAHDLILAKALVESTYAAYRSAHLGYAELILSRRTLADLRNQDFQLRVAIINAHLRCLNRCEESSHGQ